MTIRRRLCTKPMPIERDNKTAGLEASPPLNKEKELRRKYWKYSSSTENNVLSTQDYKYHVFNTNLFIYLGFCMLLCYHHRHILGFTPPLTIIIIRPTFMLMVAMMETMMTRNKRHRSAKGSSVITHYVIRHHGQMSPTTIHSHLLFQLIFICGDNRVLYSCFFRKLKQYSTNF